MNLRRSKVRGHILLISLVFFAIFFGITTAVISRSVIYDKTVRSSVGQSQALALAEAGIDKAAAQMNLNPSYTGETATSFGNGQYTVTVSTIDSTNKQVTAVGYVPSAANPQYTKTVRVNMSIDSATVSFRYGVQVGAGGFTLNGGSTVNGSVYSNADISVTTGSRITGSAVAANPAALAADQVNNSPTPIASCTSSNCITFGNANATQDFAQSFIVSDEEPIDSIRFYIKKVSTPSDATVRIVTDNSGTPSTNVLMTGTLTASSVTTSFGWVSVALPSTPILDDSETYWVVIDAGTNASRYYQIGANSSTYGNGQAKIGQYNSTWSNTTPSGLDGYFELYLGGGVSTIGGNNYVTGSYLGTNAADEAWANIVHGATVAGALFCQVGNYTSKPCNTTRSDPPPQGMPLSDGNVQDWQFDAANGGTLTGNQVIGYAGGTLGPTKIVGDLTVNGGGLLTLTGNIWITGNFTVTGGGRVTIDPSFGSDDVAIVVDGRTSLSGGGQFSGSGTAGSYPFVISTSACPAGAGCSGNPAITLTGGAGSVALIAQDGTVAISGGTALKAVTAKQITMTGGATLNYDSGLINSSFSSGPGGSWTFVSGTYTILD